jgi:hypothetical protein
VLQWINSLMNQCFNKSISLTSLGRQFCWRIACHSEWISLLNSTPSGKQFRCRFSVADSHVRNDVNAYNIVWLCNIWNTWMGTCVFLGKHMVTSYVINKYKCAYCDHWCVRLCDQN